MPNGDVYSGSTNDKGEPHDDKGKMMYANGDEYNGSFRNGKRDGNGERRNVDGS